MGKKILVVGTGTGRCGTTSFSRLLNSQKNAKVTHERYSNRLPWRRSEQGKFVSRLVSQTRADSELIVGDVALQWGNSLANLARVGARIVILKRDRSEFVESFMRKSRSRNNWQMPRDGGTPNSTWYNCFPNFAGPSKREALGQYWDFYYNELVPNFENEFPDSSLLVYLDVLNSEAGIKRVLDWIGIPEKNQVIQAGIHRNRTRNGIHKRSSVPD